ncbi:helix-turn-helix domain-containing protein [Bacillus cereus group sp. BceL216]|uniref:helix-turn-helix domain-containing protein n=6 Tax=Bacillus TaxID=1386 RepID=UPI002ABFBC3A|nr:helix-turn-helix domain-containing protein [Bacillus cereus]MDZ4524040.1 helix-turn-helix domain-containing protein [Bacillus cereus]
MSKKVIGQALGHAERSARKRDLEIVNEQFKQDHNEVSKTELEKAMEIMTKATGKELYIGTKKSPQSKVRFVQLIQDNWNYALEIGYFTDEEMLFLIRIQRFLQFKSNCIVDDIHSRSAVPMTQTKIAERLGTSKPKVSRVLKQLQEKGVVVKAIGQEIEGNNARTNAIFINPNIMFSGERDNIEVTLKALFMKSKSLLKDFPVALF